MKKSLLLLALSLCLSPAAPSGALTFDFTFGEGMTQQAKDGFTAAGALWSSTFRDNVTVRINADLRDMGSSTILGSTSSSGVETSYSYLKNLLAADRTSATDALAVRNLPSGSALSFYTNDTTGARVFDNDGSVNNTRLYLTTANAKALDPGFNYGGADADIEFNSQFCFDYNPADGIGTSMYDFIGIATHEIGHALGFESSVDIVDGFYDWADLNDYAILEPLDLFRYSAMGVLDNSFGGSPYFSIDGGQTSLGLFSTGFYHGDGRQASHWKDNLALGLLDPTAGAGERLSISGLDRTALDAIGWDPYPVPEPSTLILTATGLGLFLIRRRKQ